MILFNVNDINNRIINRIIISFYRKTPIIKHKLLIRVYMKKMKRTKINKILIICLNKQIYLQFNFENRMRFQSSQFTMVQLVYSCG